MSDFYIGYLPQAPPALARRIRRGVWALGVLGLAAAVTLVTAQHRFDASSFEYGQPHRFRGVVEASPVAVLRVVRPGGNASESRYPLVGAGKHGVESAVTALDGREVELQGMLIYREGSTLLEVVPGSALATSMRSEPQAAATDLGARTLIGEIVDTKCYAGVMNPGQGKVHRDCAARCISGGIPAALLSEGTLYYLVVDGNPAPAAVLQEFVSRPVVITGRVSRKSDIFYLDFSPRGLACARERLAQ